MKLNTIQKKKKLNNVFTSDEKGNGGANHKYIIASIDTEEGSNDPCFKSTLQFQNGARNEKDSANGVLDVDLLEIVRHRLTCFQEGEFNSKYNEVALLYVEKALRVLNQRVEDRIDRNVLGKSFK